MADDNGSFCRNVEKEFPDCLRDESRRIGSADSLSFPLSEDDVRRHLALARGEKVTVQGARTGITAGAVPLGGHVLNLSRMRKILQARQERHGGVVVAQPGVVLSELREYLRGNVPSNAAFFPPDPTESSASLGGMVACNASGARSFAYGPTRRYVQRLRVVAADGDTIELRRGEQRAKGRHFELKTEGGRTIAGWLPSYSMPNVKNAAGYFVQDDMDLIDLFIGSEGTLGVVTEIELATIPVPAIIWGLMAFFNDLTGALRMVDSVRKCGLRPVAVEFFDEGALNLLVEQRQTNQAFSDLPHLPPEHTAAIYLETHSCSEPEAEAAMTEWASFLEACGSNSDNTWFASSESEIEKLKKFRHAVPEAVNMKIDERRRSNPELTKLGTDFAVPEEALESVMMLYRGTLAKEGLEHVIFGHIGDNHLHVNILPRNMTEYARGKEIYMEWARRVVKLGGTVSAEHGIGKLKTHLLKLMYGEEGISQMRELKRLFDPEFRLNPGNLFEDQ